MSGGQQGAPDPLAALNDNFSGASLDPSWTVYNGDRLSTLAVGSGYLEAAATQGGADPGCHWYSQVAGAVERDGALIYKLVDSTSFDVRARVLVRNDAWSASPPAAAGEWRFAGIAIHDPAGLISGTFNYVHLALGSDPNGQNRIEWKVTDSGGAIGPQSTYDSDAGAADLDYDLRIVRSGQSFVPYFRRADAGEFLHSNVGWSALSVGTIEKDANTPARLSGATPTALPSEVAVGIMPPYAGPQLTVDLRQRVPEFQVATV